VISPTLFLIAFNDLLTQLRKEGFEVLAYADDLVILGNTDERIPEAIRIVNLWTSEAKMTIN